MSIGPTHTNSAALRGATPQVASAIQKASLQSGVDFSYLVTKASMESGFDPRIQATTSSASGLYQFIDRTWLEMVQTHGEKYGLGRYAEALRSGTADEALKNEILALRNDPEISAFMAAEYTRSNRQHLEASVGGGIGNTELYLAHFLGPGGAETFLRALRTDATQDGAELLPDAAEANAPIFYRNGRPRSLGEIYEHFAAKFTDQGPGVIASSTTGGISAAVREPAASSTEGSNAMEPRPAKPSPWASSPVSILKISQATQLYLMSLSMPRDKQDKDSA